MNSPLPAVLSCVRRASCSRQFRRLGLAVAGLALGTGSAAAATFQFTGAGNDGQYTTALNWNQLAVPNTSAGDAAVIGNGSAVSYTPGGDLIISNGGSLQIANGSFTQVTGNNYIQLGQQGSGTSTGNGTILVSGGTFNQGTDSAQPFNLTGTGNVFRITAGAANFNTSFNLNIGLTYSQSGGSVTVGGTNSEFDFNGGSGTLSGGLLTTRLITGQNGSGAARDFNVAGGMLSLGNATNTTYIYAPSATQYVNFTLNSTGSIVLANANAAVTDAQGLINNSGIEYNNTANSPLSDFTITKNGTTGFVTVTLAPGLAGAVPEPSSAAFAALGALGLLGWTIRLRSQSRASA